MSIEKSSDKQSRKYQLTINNPKDFDYDHARIRTEISKLTTCIYYIMSDEIGGKEETYHTHIFVVFSSPVRFSTIKIRFPNAHIESCHGTCSDNRDYILKEGKWSTTEKSNTKIPATQEQWGELPQDLPRGQKPELAILFELIQEGLSNYEIIHQYHDYLFDTDKIDRVRLILKQEEYKNTWRDLTVTYIFGQTGSGKTRTIMEEYGYEDVFRVTDYLHPFDTYKGEDIIIFEEFSSSMKIQDMLVYTDGYPCKLQCRYTDKIACYSKVYFLTNIPLEKQYPNIQLDNQEVWKAYIRRIHKVIWYKDKDNIVKYNSTEDYFNRENEFISISDDIMEQIEIPFK